MLVAKHDVQRQLLALQLLDISLPTKHPAWLQAPVPFAALRPRLFGDTYSGWQRGVWLSPRPTVTSRAMPFLCRWLTPAQQLLLLLL